MELKDAVRWSKMVKHAVNFFLHKILCEKQFIEDKAKMRYNKLIEHVCQKLSQMYSYKIICTKLYF